MIIPYQSDRITWRKQTLSRDVNSKFWDEELETLPRAELEKRQLADLQEIVQFAYDHAPYYTRSFDEAGVAADTAILGDLIFSFHFYRPIHRFIWVHYTINRSGKQ